VRSNHERKGGRAQTKGDLKEMKTRNIFTKLSLAMTVIAIVLLASSRGSAAANRTWVAPSGDDNNACTNANPCKTFTGALAKTSAGGEIVVKESGDFGQVTINKSITIDGGGKYAGIQVINGGDGVTIQAGNTDVIVLRGLTINFPAGGFGYRGINAAFGGVLHVENCAIRDFYYGIFGGGALTLFVHDVVISECSLEAIVFESGGRALIDHTRLENNHIGIIMFGGAQVTVRNTVASGNGNAGAGFSAGGGTLNLENCVASNLEFGITANIASPPIPTIVVISNSVVTNNQTGLLQDGTSVIYSRGNNTVTGNNTDISGTITPLGGS
jgi:parallel beta helix pectate lyase-like protein